MLTLTCEGNSRFLYISVSCQIFHTTDILHLAFRGCLFNFGKVNSKRRKSYLANCVKSFTFYSIDVRHNNNEFTIYEIFSYPIAYILSLPKFKQATKRAFCKLYAGMQAYTTCRTVDSIFNTKSVDSLDVTKNGYR